MMTACKYCEGANETISDLRKQLGMSTSDELYDSLGAWNAGRAAGDMIRDLQATCKQQAESLTRIAANCEAALSMKAVESPLRDDRPSGRESPHCGAKCRQRRQD